MLPLSMAELVVPYALVTLSYTVYDKLAPVCLHVECKWFSLIQGRLVVTEEQYRRFNSDFGRKWRRFNTLSVRKTRP